MEIVKQLATAAAEEMVERTVVAMDAFLWSKLPENTLEMAFARLPLKDILRLRVLNKHWKSFVCSPFFQQLLEERRTTSSSTTSFGLITELFSDPMAEEASSREFHVLDTAANEWLQFSRPSLPLSSCKPFATAGGLVCMCAPTGCTQQQQEEEEDETELQLLVCNPITGAWRELPRLRMQYCPLLARMEMDTRTKQYTVILGYLQLGASKVSIHVYDSGTDCWSKGCHATMHLLERKPFKWFFNMQYKGLARIRQTRVPRTIRKSPLVTGQQSWREVLNESAVSEEDSDSSSGRSSSSLAFGFSRRRTSRQQHHHDDMVVLDMWELQSSAGLEWKWTTSITDCSSKSSRKADDLFFLETKFFVCKDVVVIIEWVDGAAAAHCQDGGDQEEEEEELLVWIYDMSKHCHRQAPPLWLPFVGAGLKKIVDGCAFEVKLDAVP